MVITKSISRFSRNSEDLLETVELLKANQVTVIFENIHTDTEQSPKTRYLTRF
ncbi:recombinase family protein [Marinilactibacillus psychrotolerans]|uniref:recombinase family protein n=1 Tax=Marinilactibacillus psychrotolerans TaxID=191770 RepID=UPI003886AE04